MIITVVSYSSIYDELIVLKASQRVAVGSYFQKAKDMLNATEFDINLVYTNDGCKKKSVFWTIKKCWEAAIVNMKILIYLFSLLHNEKNRLSLAVFTCASDLKT